MADDYPVTRAGRPAIDTTAAPRRPVATPEDPEAARAEIEATRARMSETIDEIEDVLLRKKEKIRDQLDVLAPVREQPLKTLGMIFGAALALGVLTGGGGKSSSRADDDDFEDEALELEVVEEDEGDVEAELAWERAETWEDRAHRLLRIAKAQEAELEIHRGRREALSRRWRAHHDDVDEGYDDEIDEPNLFDRVRQTAAERLAVLASEVSQRMMRGS